MYGINLKTGVEATLVRLNAHSNGRALHNLRFLWGASTAGILETESGVWVQFPAIDEAKIVPPGLLHRLVGYAVHELGHHWFTDNWEWTYAAGKNKWLHSLINGLEDPRIERCVIESGFAGNSRNLFVGLVNHVIKGKLPVDFQNIPFLLAVEGRRLNGYEILAPQTYKTTPWAKDIEWALNEAHVATDTKTICEIAKELAKRLKGRENETNPDETTEGQPGDEQGEGGEKGEGGDEQGEGEGEEGKGQPGEGEEGEGQPGEDEGHGDGHGDGPISSDPKDWIEGEAREHQSEGQRNGQVGVIVAPTFYKFR